MTPSRIQLRRTKGWRMPPGAVKVDRTTRWGNPWRVEPRTGRQWEPSSRLWLSRWALRRSGDLRAEIFTDRRAAMAEAVARFRRDVAGQLDLGVLRGKHLACWCPEGEPCHGDVLLELANREGGDA